MRITFLTPSDNLTGGNRVVATYAAELQRRGHEVLVVSNAPDRPDWREKLRRSCRGDLDWMKPPAPAQGRHRAEPAAAWPPPSPRWPHKRRPPARSPIRRP